MNQSEIADFLRTIRLFADVEDAALQDIASHVGERQFAAQCFVFDEGTYGDAFFVVKEGQVAIVKGNGNVVLAVRRPGEFFGEMALLEDSPRSAGAKTLEPTTLLEIPKGAFLDLLQSNAMAACTVLRDLSSHLRQTDQQMIRHLEAKNKDLAQAYANLRAERERLQEAYHDTVRALVNAIEARDPYTRGHAQRVTALVQLLAEQMDIDDSLRAALEMGGLLHDVGKLGVPDYLLRKPSALTHAEQEVVKTHIAVGLRILGDIPHLKPATPYIAYHHERYDGQGYPQGLAGDAIPIQGRLMAVADAFDAMIIARPYRPALPLDAATTEIEKGSGTQFDPTVVVALLNLWHSGRLAALYREQPTEKPPA